MIGKSRNIFIEKDMDFYMLDKDNFMDLDTLSKNSSSEEFGSKFDDQDAGAKTM